MATHPCIVLVICMLLVGGLAGCIDQEPADQNHPPVVTITHPKDNATVSHLVMISGTATDADGDQEIVAVEIRINDGPWEIASDTTLWSYEWPVYLIHDGVYMISARASDGKSYSETQQITIKVQNPETVESDKHRWAVFVAAANFPKDNDSKLGNGGLKLAERIAAYLVESAGYPTSNIAILFDDGWIRSNNGFGERVMTLQERPHEYDITYGSATRDNVENTLTHVIEASNDYRDSEVFIWFYNHGYGDLNNTYTGGKILERSHIFLWDDILSDRELGKILGPMKSQETCIIIDACFCGGFADKTIINQPTSLLFRSGIPRSGRLVISGSSKFRAGYASTTEGPLFTLLWFEGLTSGNADGFKSGLLARGRPTTLPLFKDGRVSAEEAFYYARYILRTDKTLADYKTMEPQINDRYPARGIIRSKPGLILGDN